MQDTLQVFSVWLQAQFAEHKWLFSFLIILAFWALKTLLLRFIKYRSQKKGEDKRHQLNLLDQLFNTLILVALIALWSSEIQSFAISIAAFVVAIVLATRDFIQCLMGFVYYISARPFRIGDWIEINKIIGEVVEIDWAKTSLLEVDANSFAYTGKHVYIPNSHLITQIVRNLNFLRRYSLHTFSIINEPSVNVCQLLDEFTERAKAHCAHFRDVAERYKNVIERHLDVAFISTQPEIEITTNQYAKLVVTVSIFCPTEEAVALQQKISADWMNLWFAKHDQTAILSAALESERLKIKSIE